MSAKAWNWKQKNGASGGLLYESGNWGDVLKLLWLAECILWKQQTGIAVNYLDPFAGAVEYPLGEKFAFRLRQIRLPELETWEEAFLSREVWPSAASGARRLITGSFTVWDADEERRKGWALSGARLASPEPATASGYAVIAGTQDDPDAIWLVDPYDFLAEWRDELSGLATKSLRTTMLLYLYNRSGKTREAFDEYRRFRGALDDALAGRPKRIGRIAADGFLPNAYHEMIILPGKADQERPGFDALLDRLGDLTVGLNRAQERLAVFDC